MIGHALHAFDLRNLKTGLHHVNVMNVQKIGRRGRTHQEIGNGTERLLMKPSKEQTWKALIEPTEKSCDTCEYEELSNKAERIQQLTKDDPCWDCYMDHTQTNWKFKKHNKKLDKS